MEHTTASRAAPHRGPVPLSEALGEEAASAAAVSPVVHATWQELQELLPPGRNVVDAQGPGVFGEERQRERAVPSRLLRPVGAVEFGPGDRGNPDFKFWRV